MGNKSSKNADDVRSKDIDKMLDKDKKEIQNEIKLLLLGAGESGKSTLLKQMKLIYGSGFSQQDVQNCKDIIYMNVVKGMQMLIEGQEAVGSKIADENADHAATVAKLRGYDEKFTPETTAALKTLWESDSGIKAAYEQRNRLQVFQHAGYFFDQLDRISAPDFVATEDDMLKARMPTTGVAEAIFELKNHKFRVVDVGGQRSERRKWVQCFPDVNVVVFVAAISEIDQNLYEDQTASRMTESLNLFEETINNEFFRETPIILFMNKEDVLREKLAAGVDPKIAFPEYSGGCDYELATQYIKNLFVARNRNTKRDIFVRITNATDRKNMKFVFDTVTSIILQSRLEAVGFV